MWISKLKWHTLCDKVSALENRQPNIDLKLVEKIYALYDYLEVREEKVYHPIKLVKKDK